MIQFYVTGGPDDHATFIAVSPENHTAQSITVTDKTPSELRNDRPLLQRLREMLTVWIARDAPNQIQTTDMDWPAKTVD